MNEITSPNDVVNFEVSKEQLTGFFIHHLGKKSELKYSESIDFVLSINNIRQLFHLFSQKVANDENKKLDFFEIEVWYSDKTSKTFYDFDNLENYFGFKNAIPLAVSINWVVLVKFASSETIETQRVHVYFHSADDQPTGYLEIKIEHTNNIWADEVQGLLSGYLKNIKKPANKAMVNFIELKNYIQNLAAIFFTLTFFSVMLGISGPLNIFLFSKSDYGSEIHNNGITPFYKDDVKRVVLETKIPSTDKILITEIIENYFGDDLNRFITNITNNKAIIDAVSKHQKYVEEAVVVINDIDEKQKRNEEIYLKIFLSLILAALFFSALLVVIKFYSKYYHNFYSIKSFINLTQTSESECDEYYRKKSKLTFYSISATLFAVLTGLLTTAIVEIFKI